MLLLASAAYPFSLKWFYPEAIPVDTIIDIFYDRMLYGSSAALVDLPGVNSVGTDPDDWLEIVIGSDEYINCEDPSDSSQGVWRCLDAQGNLEWFRGTGTDESRSSPAVIDFYGGDGLPDIIGGTTSGWNVEAMDRFGNFLWTFPTPPFLNGPFAWHSSPAVADLVPDLPGLEVVIGCNASAGIVTHFGMWCFQADPSDGADDGITSPGWSDYPDAPGGTDGVDWDVLWYYPTDCPVISTPCVVDVDADGFLDVVFGVGHTPDFIGSDCGKVICLDGRDGSLKWEYGTAGRVPGSAAAADFDGDGDYEIVIGSTDGSLHFIDGDEDGDGTISGAEVSSFAHGGAIYSSPAIGDVDGDGELEVVAAIGNGYLKVFHYTPADGYSLEWYVHLGDSILSSPALAGYYYDPQPWPFFRHDVMRTGFYPYTGSVLHIFVAADRDSQAFLYDILGDGTVVDSVRIGMKVYASPVVADIDKDCELDLVITGANSSSSIIPGLELEGPDTIFCFGTGIPVHGCEPVEFHPHIAEVYTEGCSLVYATVCVYDEDSNYVRGLDISNFGFTENGIPIVPPRLELLNECPPETAKVDIVLLLDFSTSMDDEVSLLVAHVPEFIAALSDVDFRIAIIVFNGCPAEPDGVCVNVKTYFSGPLACTLDFSGPDRWATNLVDAECLFEAAMEMYTWPPSERGSGYEDQFGAIVRALSWLDFRPEAQKVFVLMTDERPIVNDEYCSPAWGETPTVTMAYPPDSIIAFCREESIIVIPVTPEDGDFAYAWFEDPARAYYTGYYELGDSTGGAWFNLYSDDWSELVTAIAEEIAADSCCYQFVWRETLFCTDTIHLEVTVFDTGGTFGTDDTTYPALCPPQLEISMPAPCGGITTCSGQGFVYVYLNPEDGALVESTLVLVVNGDTITAADSGVVVSESGVSYFPPEPWEHGDTVVFELARIENEFGCAASAPPCSFVVDLVPPEVLSPTPAPGETLATTDIVVSAILFDDFSGVDTAAFGAENVIITLGPDTIPFDSIHFADSLRFVVDGLVLPGDGHYTMCVNDLDDSPDYDYCPPNHLEQWCWDFFVVTVVRHVWFGDSCAHPCDTAYIPLVIDSLSGARYGSIDVWFHCDFDLLIPVGVGTSSVVAPIGDWQLEEVVPDSLWHMRIEWADTVTDSPGGVVAWLLALTNCNARGGDFTPVVIDSAAINAGYPKVTWDYGFFYALWRIGPWLHDIVVQRVGDTTRRVLAIGAASGATKGYDPTYDLLYIEPPPTEVDAYIVISDTAHPSVTKLKRDVQGFDLPDRWVIRTDTETLAVVHWNPYHLPEGRLMLNGIVNMKLETLYVWRTSEIDSVVIEWYLPELGRNDVHIARGWNLISLPYVPTHHSAEDIFPGCIGAWSYDALSGTYFYAEQLDKGVGYWLYSLVDTVYPMAGTPVVEYNRALYPGWNLVGALAEPTDVDDACTVPDGLLVPPLFGYTEGVGYYPESSTLEPGRGYWALSLGEGILSVPSGGLYCRTAPKPAPEWTATVELSYPSGRVETLEFGWSPQASEGIDGADEALPPQLPDRTKLHAAQFRREVFELARDISPRLEWWLEIDSAAAATFALPEGVRIILTAPDGDMFELAGTRQIRLEEGVYRLSSPQLAALPELALMPNHPNPFNAVTEIPFSLPRREHVRLCVKDVLGRVVDVLFDGELDPGYHSALWDGSRQPSGIYLIELATPTDRCFMRVLLVK